MEYLVDAKDLKKSFGNTHAVDDVSLQIPAGEIYGLVGADGAGKTTTMRLLVGALLPDEGECNGWRIRCDPPDRACTLADRLSLAALLDV